MRVNLKGGRHLIYLVVFLGVIHFVDRVANAQTYINVPAAPAAAHLVKRVDPIYPPLAKMARIQGTVDLEVHIGKDGSVVSAKVKQGHPILVMSAIQAVKQWKYKPFVSDSKPVEAMTTVEIPFSLGIPPDQYKAEQEISGKYFKKEDACRKLIGLRQYDQARPLCEAAVALAEQLPPRRALERTHAYADMGWVLLGQRNFGEALTYFRKEVDLDEKVRKPDDADLGYGYHRLAVALFSTGDIQGFLQYYTRAIDTLKLARKDMPANAIGEGFKAEYAKSLKSYQKELGEYSALLLRLGDTKAADTAEHLASSIQ